MAKRRQPIPSELAAHVLFQSDHTCCKCRERGKPVQIHHIDENPSNGDPKNLSVLCFLCHHETQISGGFARNLHAEEVIAYRDDWISRVKARRDKADEIATMAMSNSSKSSMRKRVLFVGEENLIAYVESLPIVLNAAYTSTSPRVSSGVTWEMVEGIFEIVDVVEQVLVKLASWFPENHFGNMPANEYFSDAISRSVVWQRALAEPDGSGTAGTDARIHIAFGVLGDAKEMVRELVDSLLVSGDGTNEEVMIEWGAKWSNARNLTEI
ncbi:MAG: HNH endonuclease [Candidatus Obscuribacterales bacterium]|nr:HNH endonuclease [Candidatus Obscuribacterales bacterium]